MTRTHFPHRRALRRFFFACKPQTGNKRAKKGPTSMVQVGRDLMFNCSGIDIESCFLTKFRPLCFFHRKTFR
ncbi:hypothetical protein AERO8C_20601 [Aeromonas veronii]|uniref:Uncharacterized protein n=1 Tax=Aeromonas veronii TaxID=654 RepID=A0A653L2H6_AERVE|nr:hypothetical protein AERO8C_20601 [Aeromonas veronii]